MNYYFEIQFIRLKRYLGELGINPLIGIILGFLTFLGLSALLFYKTSYANWIYLFIALNVIYKHSSQERNYLLKDLFSLKDYYKVRIIENTLTAFVFQIYMFVEKAYLSALILIPLAILLAFIQRRQLFISSIPTPFKRYPFEFIIGFRKTFWLIFLAYFLIFKSIQVGNFNLGVFGLSLIFLIALSYYAKPESEYFVWIHIHKVKGFLRHKFITSILCVSILSFMAVVAMIIAFPNNWIISLVAYLIGCMILGSMILAKYAAFPFEINLPQAILYALGLILPPMLILVCWMFYKQSRKNLKPILE